MTVQASPATASVEAAALVSLVAAAGGRIAVDGTELVVDLPRDRLTDDLARRLRSAKPALIAFLSGAGDGIDEAEPQVTADPANRHAPFPLNENQQAYWLGRDDHFEQGGVAIRIYLEIERAGLDPARFEHAWRRLVAHHDMLRAVVLPDGRQQVLADPPLWSLPVEDLTMLDPETEAARLLALREELSHECHDLERWPTWTIRALRRPGGVVRLLVGIDCWAIDGRSWQVMFGDLATLYEDGDAVLKTTGIGFRDYILAAGRAEEGPAFARDLAYWQARIPHLPGPPPVPRAARLPEGRPRFRRLSLRIDAGLLAGLKRRAAARGLTLASTLLAAYAEVFDRWSGSRHFMLNVPRWNRRDLHPDVPDIIGEFATFTLLEVDNRPTGNPADDAFAARARRLQDRLWTDLAHARVSGVRVLREWRRLSPDAPAGTIPFVFTDEPDSRATDGAADDPRTRSWMASISRIGDVVHSLSQTPQVWIDTQYHELDGTLLGHWDAHDALFPDGLVDDMFAGWEGLIRSLAAGDDAWSDPCPIPLPAGQIARRRAANATAAPIDRTELHDAVTGHAGRLGDAMAVADGRGRLSWTALADRIAETAGRLAAAGMSGGDVIAVAMRKGAAQLVAAQAIQRLGAVMVAVDPDLPPARRAHILADSGARLVLVDETTAGVEGPAVMAVDIRAAADPALVAAGRGLAAPDPARPLAALVYTSGSTGLPKGVMVPREGLFNLATDIRDRFALGPDDTAIALAPLHHDLGLVEALLMPRIGVAVVFPDPDRARDPGHWIELAARHRITFWNSVPAMVTMLADHAAALGLPAPFPDLRVAVLSGDWIPLDTPARLARLAPRCRLQGSGGPTETTIWNLFQPVDAVDPAWTSIPYGRPARNSGYHVLDDAGRDCPDHVTGELCATGAGLSPGYLNDPERTARVFVPHPVTGERMMRTGDLGRWRPDGRIEFVGRADGQVKLNGIRIELGEIEAQLTAHETVGRAVALPIATGDGRRIGRLAAVVTAAPGAAPDPQALAAWLAGRLPRQVIPAPIRVVAQLPLTANGKIDRAALTALITDGAAAAIPACTGGWPATAAERAVDAAWTEILGAPPADPERSLFDAGGDSLAAIRLYGRLVAGKVAGASVMSVFRAGTPRALARLITAGRDGAGEDHALPPVTALPAPRPDRGPATTAQARLWLEELATGDTTAYVLAFAMPVSAGAIIDPAAIDRAWCAVLAADEALRTRILADDQGRPEQHVDPAPATALLVDDVSAAADPGAAAEALARQDAATGFALGRDRPARLRLILTGRDRGLLVFSVHHAAIDGMGVEATFDRLAAALDGRPVAAPAIQPLDYAAWEALPAVRAAQDRDVGWWADRLGRGAAVPPAAAIETGRPRPPRRGLDGRHIDRPLDAAVIEGLGAIARRVHATPYAAVTAGLAALLARWTADAAPLADRVVIGTHLGLRDRPELDGASGLMVNNLVLAIDTGDDPDFATLVARTGRILAEAWSHGLAPFERVVAETGAGRDPRRHPLFDISLAQEGLAETVRRAGGLTLGIARPLVARAHLDLDIAVRPAPGGGWRLGVTHAPAVIDGATARLLLDHLAALLTAAVADPARPVSALDPGRPALVPAETAGETPGETPDMGAGGLFGLWAGRCATRPGTALLDGDGRPLLDAAALDARAERLAAGLAAAGVGAGDRVVVPLAPSADMLALWLGLWRLGAVVVPIGPDQPPARRAAILDRLRPSLVAEDPAALVPAAPAPAPVRIGADAPAMIIHTSGSTGTPRGVVLSHGAIARRLAWGRATFPPAADDRVLARSSVDFVDAVAELLSPLMTGTPLALCPPEDGRDPRRLAARVRATAATRLLVVPSLLDALCDAADPADLGTVRLWTSSGEALPAGLIGRWRRLAAPGARLINIYGAAEVTADAAWFDATEVTADPVPAGRPVAGAGFRILDGGGRVLPRGMAGRVAISGGVLAIGYDADPGATAARFPVAEDGTRLCLTGDRGLIDAAGRLVVLGRADGVVKIRGQRVDPAETLSALREVLPGREAAVIALDGVLVAAVTGGPVDPAAVRAALAGRLTPAALPARIVPVDALPRGPAGKLDRPALAALLAAAPPTTSPGAPPQTQPRTPTERRLAALWREVLPATGAAVPIGRHSDFFGLGGHSLAAARLAVLSGAPDAGFVFTHPTLAAQAAALDARTPVVEELI